MEFAVVFRYLCVIAFFAACQGRVERSLSQSIRIDNEPDIRIKRQIRQGRDYILELKLWCPDSDVGAGKVELWSDIPATAVAECENGNHTFTGDIPKKSLKLDLSSITGNCQMWKHSGQADTYSVVVRYGAGGNASELFFSTNIRNAICNYDNHRLVDSNISRMLPAMIRPIDLPIYNGAQMTNMITMYVINVLGRALGKTHVHMNRLIQLKAVVNSLDASIYPITCKAMNDINGEYKIIRGSCGDGIVFDKNDGFYIRGNETYSPFFRAFRLAGSYNMKFQCMFAKCSNCNGMNSCPYHPMHQETTNSP